MPRPLRRAPAGLVYHVLNRAADRRPIFESAGHFDTFCGFLRQAATESSTRICGYCVMPNHWHLMLWPAENGVLSACLHWVTTRHSMEYRRRSGTLGHGHVYQGRFKSFPVETSRYYYNVLKYVEANPLRAGLVPKAEEWPWSSLYERTNRGNLVASGPLELPSHWTDIVNGGCPADELKRLRASAVTGRPYGSEQWIDETASALELQQKLRGRGRPEVRPRGAVNCA